MTTTKLELGIVGDFLMGSFSAHPSPLKGEEGHGLRPEHFSDPSARAAFELIVSADTTDAATLQDLLSGRMGVAFCEKAIAEASIGENLALARLATLAERGRVRIAADELSKLVQRQGEMSEAFFFAEADRIVRGTSATVRAAALTAETAEEFTATPPAPLDPIVANCFEAGDKVELIAPSKCRKSFFALDLALHVAAGYPFCGLAIPKPRCVLLVNLEIKRDWMKRRVLQRLGGYGLSAKDLQGRLLVMNCRGQGGSWLSDGGRGAEDIRGCGEARDEFARRKAAAIAKVRRKAPHLLATLRLILKNGKNRKESIWQLMKSQRPGIARK